MPYLCYQDASGQQTFHELFEHEVLVGRLAKCDIVLKRPTVSRRHARFYRSGDRWFVADLGSSHGVRVNDEPVQEHALKFGDTLQVGSEVLIYQEHPKTGKAPSGDRSQTRPIPLPFDELEPDEPTNPDEVFGSSRSAGGDIVAEQALDGGHLVQAIAHARKLDVTRIVENPLAVLADLEAAKDASGEDPAVPGIDQTSASPSDVAGHLLTLVRISDELRRSTNVEEVCRCAVEMMMEATRASRGVIAVREGAGFIPVVQRSLRKGDQEVKVSRTFVDKMVQKRVALVALDTGLDQSLSTAKSVVAMQIRSILCAPLWDSEDILGYLYLDQTGAGRPFGPSDLDFASAVGHQAAAEIKRLRLLDAVRSEQDRRRNLARFLADDVIRHIEQEAEAGRLDPTLSTREQQVTILFADIEGFTTLSEQLEPSQIKRLLDDYFDRMTEILVDRYKGTLDKYIGDAIMALYGAPFSISPEIDARNAVAAAVAMRDTVAELHRDNPNYARFQIRIGINSGRVVAGMIGSQRRLEYSVLGDAVNVASRLESTAATGSIQIGESTFELVRDTFDCRFAGERKVKNRAKPVAAWVVQGFKKGKEDQVG